MFNIFKAIKNRLSRKKAIAPKKLGLALGSGGAKGMAHLGALKALEEAGIKFDVIAGTSIGAIIGAFLADGYTATDVYHLLKTMDVKELAKNVGLRKDMTPFRQALEKYLGTVKIEELKKPYCAVCAHCETLEEVRIKSGQVSYAITASGAMPPFFLPVTIDGVELIDGAYSNAIPSNVAKELGADFVIGIDLSAYPAKEATGAFAIIEKFLSDSRLASVDSKSAGYKHADYMLRPNLSNYKATSFKSLEDMYQIGYELACAELPQIIEKLRAAGFDY